MIDFHSFWSTISHFWRDIHSFFRVNGVSTRFVHSFTFREYVIYNVINSIKMQVFAEAF